MARSRSRRGLLVVLLLVVVGLAALAWIGVRAQAAQGHLETARDALLVARTAVTDRRLDEARSAVDVASQATGRARNLTGDPVWDVVGAVPWAGATVRTAAGLAAAADTLARDVLPTALSAAQQADPAALRRADGSVDLAVLRAVTPDLVASATEVAGVQRRLGELPRGGVVPPVARARDELTEQVEELAGAVDQAERAVLLAPALLGEDRPRRYVVLVQQNAESRGTGGLPGGYAVLEASDGRLRVLEAGSNADLPDGAVAVPPGVSEDYRVRYGRLGAFDRWVNVNLSPDLPTVARVVAQRFAASKGLTLDGVAVVDAQGLTSLLSGGDPLVLPDGTVIPIEGLTEYLAVGQYAAFAPRTGDVNDRAQERKDALGVVGAQTAARLASGGGDTEALIRGLSAALRSGHLRMTSDDPALALLAASGVDGALPSADRPVAYPVVFNSTGSKLDHYLDRSLTRVAGPCDGGRRASRIEVTLANRAPADGLPPYVTIRQDGRGGITSTTDNAVTLSVYATAGSTLRRAALDGLALGPDQLQAPVLTRFVEGGLTGWSLNVELPRDTPRTLVLELDEPALNGAVQVPAQPLARELQVTTEAEPCG